MVHSVVESFVPSVGDCRLPQRTRLERASLPKNVQPLDDLLTTLSEPPKQRRVFHYVAEDFINAVVTPTYRNLQHPPRYYVINIW